MTTPAITPIAALELIANTDPVDAALDPQRLRDIASAALASQPELPETVTDGDLEGLAHAANQEALSFGVSIDPFLKLAKTIKARCMAAPADKYLQATRSPIELACVSWAKIADKIAKQVCQDVAELPDRNSPEDWPDAMLVTAEELHQLVMFAVSIEQPSQAQTKRLHNEDEAVTPVLYVSPEQLAVFQDKSPRYGSYLPMRRTPVGKFTQPLYTSPQSASADSKGDIEP